VAVRGDREDEAPRQRGIDLATFASLEGVPAEVEEWLRARPAEVDLLPLRLTDVGDVQSARAPFEREAPRIAQPVGDDDGLLDGTFDVEADELAEQVARALGSVLDPVPDRRVETSVGAERELAAEVRVPSRFGCGILRITRRVRLSTELTLVRYYSTKMSFPAVAKKT
jgi:hypothetical protein